MKRTTLCITLLVLLLSLVLASCDAMFTNNLFAKMTHKTPTADELSQKTTTELASFTDSNANMQTLASDQTLKDAALLNLQTTYTTSTDPTEVQLAAETYAKIEIETVPSAAKFSGSLLGALAGSASSGSAPSTEADVVALLKNALGSDIVAALDSGSSTPPVGFTDMISAFLGANFAYQALGNSIGSSGVYSSDATDAEKNEIAVNAVLSALISSAVPAGSTGTPTDQEREQALWSALRDPSNASNFVSLTAFSDLSGTSGGSFAYVQNLVAASSLGSLFN